MLEQQKNETTYLFATIGSRTERGGRVTQVTSRLAADGLNLARVGDKATYEDGSEAIIIDGAGSAAVYDDRPLALVGSRLGNGDTITQTLQDGYGISVCDGELIPGLFDPAYMPPLSTDADRGPNHA
ncbi:MAG TPA: PAAR domain-containing protein [Paraburkholderia sp.]|nr:PAAR domain-containing protein [Paraburkholderia sp.]